MGTLFAWLVPMDLPLYCALLVPGLLILIFFKYGSFLKSFGRPHYSRVEEHGGSVLLTKTILVMFYWSFQPLANALVQRKVSPNSISVVSLVVGFASGIFASMGLFAPAVLCLATSGLLDVLDGMVARRTQKTSEVGYVLDSQLDRYVEFFFLGGLIIFYRSSLLFQLIALSALMGSSLVSYSTLMARFMEIKIPAGSVLMRRSERLVYLVAGAYFSVLSISLWESKVQGGVVWGYPMVISLALVSVVSNGAAIHLLLRMLQVLKLRDSKAFALIANSKCDSVAKVMAPRF